MEFNLDEEDDEGLIGMDLEIISDDNQKPQANSMYFYVILYHLGFSLIIFTSRMKKVILYQIARTEYCN